MHVSKHSYLECTAFRQTRLQDTVDAFHTLPLSSSDEKLLLGSAVFQGGFIFQGDTLASPDVSAFLSVAMYVLRCH
jgi:hypothetical protein